MAKVQKNIDKLRSLIHRADYNAKNILNDGLEFRSPFDSVIELLVFLPEDDDSIAFEICRYDLEKICMSNGMDEMDTVKHTDDLFEFLIYQATRFEIEDIKKECIELMVSSILELA